MEAFKNRADISHLANLMMCNLSYFDITQHSEVISFPSSCMCIESYCTEICCQGVLRRGVQVAVKKLSIESKQGAREFLTEIKTISNVRHPNLVELIGCCAQNANRILVYEYLENNSLDHVLLGI